MNSITYISIAVITIEVQVILLGFAILKVIKYIDEVLKGKNEQ